ncbi:alpha/beta hydrolase family protein [Actinomadura macrotermitis]|uniref:AB hydrolase-1 domain-containing protein n=1 Tax=Actinomadura macrotermitis TaxID=2585200 RepID=A0A7K0BRR0_9ACTN|nr:alpha/beta fold hydrolase [Actinomadura macrotermitis]MQY03716.1 hypothetical protein [Actinomadura macrotermitis]
MTRLRRLLLIALPAVLVLLASAVAGIGWYFSGAATEVEHGRAFRFRIVDARDGTVTLPRDHTTDRPGTWGLVWQGGRGVLGEITAGTRGTVTRRVVAGAPVKGARAVIDHWVWAGDPRSALGLEYRDVRYPSRLGPMPAWFLPAPGRTWVIAVHGRNADRAETFRGMRAVHAAGLPMLSIAYRNDEGAPPSPDRRNHLGDTERQDLASAIGYARAQGAEGVVLYGWSMGGAMAMRTLRDDRSFVRGVVLDSPVMDWTATLDKQGAQRNLPQPVTSVAERILQWRIGIDLADYDQRRYAAGLKVPVLLFTADEDWTVANGPALQYARRAPAGLVTHVSAPEAGHTDAWNVAPAAYERTVTTFLRGLR